MSKTATQGGSGRVTIRTVAEDAGVSVAAVSKVLRDAYGVSEALRTKVEASIGRLGYRPSVAARGMRGRTYTIGILLIEISNPFLSLVVDGVNAALGASRYKALIGLGHSATAIETTLIESMIDYRMDGLLLIAPRIEGEELERVAAQIPVVAVAHHQPDARAFDTVNSDDRAGAALAVRAMVERGHRDIAFLSYDEAPDHATAVGRQREAGYLDAMAQAGLSDRARIIRHGSGGFAPSDPSVFDQLLVAADRPRAMVIWSDLFAVPLLNAARMRGLDVPGDLAIAGYDNSPVGALPLIGLASVDQDPGRLGGIAVTLLLDRIEGRTTPEHRLVAPRFVPRGSI
ncbi:LacI family DNA-binding transcriptional regulator [Wenxinia marina]|uniref:Transcriptional regulator, LacI family n=1 Tax=Wenxinia marina DSM 24838 TaxID=1123501 RepID=A0A0D0QAG4_9RHOB|nr:LacI family DNA-binding transcriptional regulator [Wenxinia marina]KIQ69307.1 transcriptional regulator, LacI family [Wenxinia marina DSM 24838]GGL72013.1 LacI family transcriptional regulator [Wenxinia marina]